MRGLSQLAFTEFKLNLRDPLMVFWSLAFPALWVVLMSVVVPGPIPGFEHEGLNQASLYLPAGISLVIACASFIGVPLTLTTYRDTQVLRRLRATPVKVWILITGFSLSQSAFALAGILILMALGLLVLGVQVLGSWPAFVAVILLGMVTFLALGAAIGSISPSMRTANIIIWVLFLPMLMLGELFMPIAVLPEWLQSIARGLPLTALTTLLRDIVYGVALTDLWRLGVLAAWTALALIITILFFRWE
jgi:ABC-2 type transport system permease protein